MLSGITHMEQNKLAWVTCHSKATLLGHLCFQNMFLSQNLLSSQMPSPPTPGLYLLVASPVVWVRAPLALAGWADCPGISFFLPNLCGELPKLLLSWERGPCQQKTTHWPKTCCELGGQEWRKMVLPCEHFCLLFFPMWPAMWRPYALLGNNRVAWFFPLSFFFFFGS